MGLCQDKELLQKQSTKKHPIENTVNCTRERELTSKIYKEFKQHNKD